MKSTHLIKNEEPGETPVLQGKLTRTKISQKEIKDVNDRYRRFAQSAADVARQAIELGDILLSMKARTAHGGWLRFIEQNFAFTSRTATRLMRAAEKKYDPMLSFDPAEFMARMWGNEPKQLEDSEGDTRGKSDVTSDLDDESSDEDDDSQHGGAGFDPGFTPDKHRPGFFNYKNLVAYLEANFFGSPEIALQAKLDFIRELVRWLEHKLVLLEKEDITEIGG